MDLRYCADGFASDFTFNTPIYLLAALVPSFASSFEGILKLVAFLIVCYLTISAFFLSLCSIHLEKAILFHDLGSEHMPESTFTFNDVYWVSDFVSLGHTQGRIVLQNRSWLDNIESAHSCAGCNGLLPYEFK